MPEPEHTAQAGEFVYVIGTPGSNTVKIGRTIDPARRLKEIQRMSPVPLQVLWVCPGGHELERELHRHFRDARSHGEWFTFKSSPVETVRAAATQRPWLKPPPAPVRTAPSSPPAARPVVRIATRPVVTLRTDLQLSSDSANPLERALALTGAELLAIPDPIERFRAVHARRNQLADLQSTLQQTQQRAAKELKEGRSWREVGELLEITGSRAEQIAKRA